MILKDFSHAFRAATASPGFATVAILSLALGIGANAAIFSLWKSVAFGSLPGVEDPGGLLIVTNPAASGLWRGRWNTTSDGPRSWVTFEEFEHLRDQATSFSALMAAQSSLNTWPVRVNNGAQEEVRGRMVSGEFFEVLGARPAAGRLFTRREDAGEPLYAVISHAFWQRRFGARPEAVGALLRLRDLTVTITGVAPPGFIGETNGQLPDMWLPLRLQPRVMPGNDFLRDQPPDKVMWLHVFGRLRPGVTPAQAEAQVNALLRANLESFYGNVGANRRREVLDQHLRVSPGARGVSATVGQFSSSLAVLLTAVGILLLIACANLANLLLARAAARRAEIAIRVSFGASRARLIRQLVGETLALAAVAGVAALSVAYLLHDVLVTMLQQADSWFTMSFALDFPVLAFTLGATLVTGLVVGVIPAVQMTRSDVAPHLRDQSRGAIGSRTELRSGRWLVAFQLALALPLLVGAGLLMRTVYNLQHPELGFRSERLLLARVNLGEAATDVGRRDRLLREIHTRLQSTQGIEAVTFSQLGLLGGGVSTAGIVVEGSALTAERPREGALDRVGAGYFATLGIPLRTGRDISAGDSAASHKVAVVNEAFVQRFFDGRSPIGLRITNAGDQDAGTAYEVIGVAGNARTHTLRGDVEARFFVPAEQRGSGAGSRVFIIRTAGSVASVAATVRAVASAVDPVLTVSEIAPLENRLAELTAEDGAVARLAIVFGIVALMLAAAGLYGVLSYSVSRRSGEIAIRIALGAQAQRVVGMIMRDSMGVVLAGLTAGAALAYPATRLIAGRLYEVAPQDPATIAAAIAGLLFVAAAAAYLPARRASRVNPMAALHKL